MPIIPRFPPVPPEWDSGPMSSGGLDTRNEILRAIMEAQAPEPSTSDLAEPSDRQRQLRLFLSLLADAAGSYAVYRGRGRYGPTQYTAKLAEELEGRRIEGAKRQTLAQERAYKDKMAKLALALEEAKYTEEKQTAERRRGEDVGFREREFEAGEEERKLRKTETETLRQKKEALDIQRELLDRRQHASDLGIRGALSMTPDELEAAISGKQEILRTKPAKEQKEKELREDIVQKRQLDKERRTAIETVKKTVNRIREMTTAVKPTGLESKMEEGTRFKTISELRDMVDRQAMAEGLSGPDLKEIRDYFDKVVVKYWKENWSGK